MTHPTNTPTSALVRSTALAACLLWTLLLGACATADQIATSAKTTATGTASETSSAASTAQSRISFPAANDHPLLELRTYTTNPGKLDALHSRFRDHTMSLFEKHGAKNIAYWTPTELPDTLIYIIAHKSAEAREATWKSFLEDPVWQAAYAASIADGNLVANIDSVMMRATDYSPRG